MDVKQTLTSWRLTQFLDFIYFFIIIYILNQLTIELDNYFFSICAHDRNLGRKIYFPNLENKFFLFGT